jgi:glycosyltransferase involved in cell wall biosynthesis
MGYGPLKDFIESFIYDNDLSDEAEVVDTTNNSNFNQVFFEKLKEADVFLYPAIKTDKGNEEGTPVCILCAMSTGLPVVASDVGGISEIVDHDVNGILVEQKNVESLSKAMISLMEGLDKRKKLSLSARDKIVREFNIKKQTDKLIEIYRSVL